jgi:hypothetical protein
MMARPRTSIAHAAWRRKVAIAAAAIAGVALAILAGTWVGRLVAPDEASPPVTRDVRAGDARLVVPAEWRPVQLAKSGVAGLDPASSVAFEPAPGLPGWVVAAVAPADHPSLIPRALRALLAASPPRPRAVQLAGRPAWRYPQLVTRVDDRSLDVTVLATTRGVLSVACVSRAVARIASCASEVSFASVVGGAPLAPSASVALAHRLPVILGRLDRARVEGRSALGRARTRAAQDAAARRLAHDHRAAAEQVRAAGGVSGASLAQRLESSARAYAGLARAASRGSVARFAGATREVSTAETRLARAVEDIPERTPPPAPTAPPRPRANPVDARASSATSPVLVLAMLALGAAIMIVAPLAFRPAVAAYRDRGQPTHLLETVRELQRRRRSRTAAPARQPRIGQARPKPQPQRRPTAPPPPPARVARPRSPAPPVPPAPEREAQARSAAPASPPARQPQPRRRSRAASPPPATASPAPAAASAPPAAEPPLAASALDASPPASEHSWRCEITWKAGLRHARFHAEATAPGEERRIIAQSEGLDWPPGIAPDRVPELVDAAEAVQRALADAGWTPVDLGSAWYERRFDWTHPDAPQQLGTVAPTGWRCEITWRARLRAASFRATAVAPGEKPRLIAESAPLQWPPLLPPAPEPEIVDAARAVQQALIDGGWTPLDVRRAWYACRFDWPHAEAPGMLTTAERSAGRPSGDGRSGGGRALVGDRRRGGAA